MADNFKVANLDLWDWGRKEIAIAETEMPGPDGAARGVRGEEAAQGRARRRLPAHDDPDRGADRDAARARRRGDLDELQHLLDPGPRRGRHRQGRRAGVRLEGRDRGGVRLVHRAAARGVRRRQGPEHDPRRRRRPDPRRAREVPAVLRGQGRHPRPLRGDDHGRAPPLRDGRRRASSGARPSTSTTR